MLRERTSIVECDPVRKLCRKENSKRPALDKQQSDDNLRRWHKFEIMMKNVRETVR